MRRINFSIILLLLLVAFASQASAQEPGHNAYTGQERRTIKSLSPEEIEQLLKGHGMGLAKAAELNHYPGPRHVLDLTAQLQLTPEQRARTQQTFERMQNEAMRLGRQIVEKEKDLDVMFAEAVIDSRKLQAATAEIARLQGSLRAVHLEAHLDMRRILSPAQIKKYDDLRGYTKGQHTPAPQHNHHHDKH